MKRLILLLCFGIVAHTKPSLPVHANVGAIYKGPNSETIIKGPDGSVITAEANGGSVVVNADHAIATSLAEAGSLSQAPIVVKEIPTAVNSQVVAQPPILNALAINTPVVAVSSNVATAVPIATVTNVNLRNTASLEGPSGSILRLGEDAVISGPASTTIKEGQVVASITNLEVKTLAAPVPTVETVAVVTPAPIALPGLTVNSVAAQNLANAVNLNVAARIATAENANRQGLIEASLLNVNSLPQERIANAQLLALQQAALAENARVIAEATNPGLSGGNGIINGIQQLPQGTGPITFGDGRIPNDVLLAAQETERAALAAAAERNALVHAAAIERNALAQAAEAERNTLAQAVASGAIARNDELVDNRILLAKNAERNALAQAIDNQIRLIHEVERNVALTETVNSGLINRPDLVTNPYQEVVGINPVITQGGQIISDIASASRIPLLPNGNIIPTKLRRVGPNGNIVSSTFRPTVIPAALNTVEGLTASTVRRLPGYQVSTAPIPTNAITLPVASEPLDARPPVVLASNLHNRRPIILQPDGVAQAHYVGDVGRPGSGVVGIAATNGVSSSDIAKWRASLANGHVAAEAVLPKQLYRDVIH